ncbi:hypothetical protein D3C81_1638120 [compost metagenome]
MARLITISRGSFINNDHFVPVLGMLIGIARRISLFSESTSYLESPSKDAWRTDKNLGLKNDSADSPKLSGFSVLATILPFFEIRNTAPLPP